MFLFGSVGKVPGRVSWELLFWCLVVHASGLWVGGRCWAFRCKQSFRDWQLKFPGLGV